MKYHCGLLDERPENSRTLKWIRATDWGHLPPEIEHELRVWLAMPGFAVPYHMHTFRMSRHRFVEHPSDFDDMKSDVIENWLSATREDCVKLARMRPGTGNVPLISQIRALEDLKHMRLIDVARGYGVTTTALMDWRKAGFRVRGQLPTGFELLVKSRPKSIAL